MSKGQCLHTQPFKAFGWRVVCGGVGGSWWSVSDGGKCIGWWVDGLLVGWLEEGEAPNEQGYDEVVIKKAKEEEENLPAVARFSNFCVFREVQKGGNAMRRCLQSENKKSPIKGMCIPPKYER